jgi:EmrB/QacA subfamily drug resistance transporter
LSDPDPALPRWRAFPPLALGVVMATLDVSVVNIALPTLSRTFGVPLTRIEWVVLGYVVTLTGLLLTLGRLADRMGRRRVYGTGLAVFAIASALCAAAPSAALLVAARVLQGFGAAMMSANSGALLVASFPSEERGRALGAFGAAVGIGLAVGTPLGGFVIAHASWRWLFLINLPIAALAGRWLMTRVPADPPPHAGAAVDFGSAIAWCVALVTLMLALSRGPETGWTHPLVVSLFAGSLIAFAAFAWLDGRASQPMLPARLVRGPLGLAVLLTLIGQALSVSAGFHVPLYLEGVLAFSPAESGVWMAALPVAALIAAPLAGQLADRFGTRAIATLGMAITLAGDVLLAGLGTTLAPLRLLLGLALIGAGQGLFAVPNASALLSLVPQDLLGFASGLQATMRNLGIAGGAAATAAIVASAYAARTGQAAAAGHALNPAAFAAATRVAFTAGSGLALAGCALTLLLRGAAGRRQAA